MTKLEEKLKELKFNRYKEQSGNIYYEKGILAFKLNSANTIKTIYTLNSEGYLIEDLVNVFNEFTNDLRELSKCQD